MQSSIELTHANWKHDDSNPVKVQVVAQQIFAAFHMPTAKATAVIGPGGANLIVTEPPEEVIKLRDQLLNNHKEEQ